MDWLIKLLGGVTRADHEAALRQAKARAQIPYSDAEVEQVLAWIDEHLEIHRQWIAYAKAHPDDIDRLKDAGGLEHHQKYLARYGVIRAAFIASQQEIARLRGQSPY